MKADFWNVLLSEWRKQGHIGLTIPFIIGSQKFLPDTHAQQNIENLINSIVINNDTLIAIKYCFTTEDLIMERVNSIDGQPGFFPTINNHSQKKLFLKGLSTDLGESCELVIENLKSRYQLHIDIGNYSKNERERGSYLQEEINFIKAAFEIYF